MVSCPPVWPECPTINNVITKRDDLVKLCSLPYSGTENGHVISEVATPTPTNLQDISKGALSVHGGMRPPNVVQLT